MISNRIRCLKCGHEGPREISGIVSAEPKENIFSDMGHSPYTGYLYYRCPFCCSLVSVNPTDVLGKDTVNGFPVSLETYPGRQTKSKDFMSTWKGVHT
jgi:hypothetical protein